MTMKHETNEHLVRYIANRNRRTDNTWRVVERYATTGFDQRCTVDAKIAYWQRAIIENENGERVRIYYRYTHWTIAS
jgi:hypothetical protein